MLEGKVSKSYKSECEETGSRIVNLAKHGKNKLTQICRLLAEFINKRVLSRILINRAHSGV